MGKLFITGDTHCGSNNDMVKLLPTEFCRDGLTKDDILVIMGDAGFIWSEIPSKQEIEAIKFMNEAPWTTFCVLGNHECYDAIEKLPTVTFGGEECWKVSDSIYYAMSGKIYDLLGQKCLVVNGADSHDIFITGPFGEKIRYRHPHISWWEQEQIKEKDIDTAKANLQKYNNTVDFVFSHTGGLETCKYLGFKPTISDERLSRILKGVVYKRHYCGHYHKDMITSGARIIYDDIAMIATSDKETLF